MRLLLLALSLLPAAFAEEPLVKSLYPTGGGHFQVRVSPCKEKSAVINGSLTNNTDSKWLYIEIQGKATLGNSTATYRFNLERIGEKDATFKQPIETNADCSTIRLSDLE